MLIPVERANLRTHITSHLFDAILRGDLRPGKRIVEGKLARELGVAQSTLREALQQLEHHGLVTKSDRRGAYVTQLSAKAIEDLYVVRLELEELAASLACGRMSTDKMRQLEDVVEEMSRYGRKHEFLSLVKADFQFHQLIWRFCGNSYLEKALNAVCPPLFACYMMRVYSSQVYDCARDIEEHVTLLKVLKKGDPKEVRKVFRAMTEVFQTQDVSNLRTSEPNQTSGDDKEQG
jgi:DNA-binding GntR family transcriptional regulator